MAFTHLVRALDEPARAAIEATARHLGLPSATEPAALGAEVRALSDVYNHRAPTPEGVARSARAHLAARLGFSFPRDVPKGAAAVRELVGLGLLDAPLRVLDVGAGLGAMTWGVARALEAAGRAGAVHATLLDEDARTLEVARALGARMPRGPVPVRLETLAGPVSSAPAGPFDLVLVGQVLSELDEGAPAAERVERHLALLERLVSALSECGALVVVEPALRPRARHLHELRGAWLGRGGSVFAPCLHAGGCPALAAPSSWCHEALDVDLPTWLVPVARAAGLRWQGLSFSYLVVRRDGATLRDHLPRARVRAISELLISKGKREAWVCGAGDEPALGARLRRLDRDESPANRAWSELRRGDLLALDVAGPRIGPETPVEVLGEAPR